MDPTGLLQSMSIHEDSSPKEIDKALHSHEGDPERVEALLHHVFVAHEREPFRQAFLKKKGTAAFLDSLKHHEQHRGVTEKGARIWQKIALSEDAPQHADDGISWCLSALKNHSDSPELSVIVFDVMERLGIKESHQNEIQDIIPIVLKSVESNASDEELQERAYSLLSTALRDHVPNQQLFLSHGGANALKSSMKQHRNTASVGGAILKVLRYLAEQPDTLPVLYPIDPVSLVCKIVQTHPESLAVSFNGSASLMNLVYQDIRHAATVVKITSQILEQHAETAQIVENILAILWNYATHAELGHGLENLQVPRLIWAIQQHAKRPTVAEYSCGALQNLAAFPTISPELVSHQAPHALCEIMSEHREDCQLLEMTLNALSAMQFCPDFKMILSEPAFCEIFCINWNVCVRKHLRHLGCQEALMRLLLQLLKLDGGFSRPLVEHDSHACVISSIDEHQSSMALMLLCMEIIDQMGEDSVAMDGLLRAKVLLPIEHGMLQHIRLEKFQSMALSFLWDASNNGANHQAILALGLLNVVEVAVKTYPRNREIITDGVGFFSNLAAFESNHPTLLRHDISGLVLSCMTHFSEDEEIQALGLTLLKNLAGSKAADRYLRAEGAVQTIASVMQRHPSSKMIQRQACDALLRLVANAENDEILASVSALSLILHAIDFHQEDTAIVEAGTGVLAAFASESEQVPGLIALHVPVIATRCLQKFPHEEEIVENCVRALGFLAVNVATHSELKQIYHLQAVLQEVRSKYAQRTDLHQHLAILETILMA